MEHAFHLYNKFAADGIAMALDSLLKGLFYRNQDKSKGAGTGLTDFSAIPPVIVCIGTDLAIADSLGPITGSMLKYKMQGANAFLYGTLTEPVTAKEIKYVRAFLKETHKNCPIIAIDAAVGDKGDVGMIKLSDAPLMPGVGAKKQLGELGDISIMGVVAEKSIENFGILNNTRLNLVYSMAEIISDAVASLLWNREGKTAKNA